MSLICERKIQLSTLPVQSRTLEKDLSFRSPFYYIFQLFHCIHIFTELAHGDVFCRFGTEEKESIFAQSVKFLAM